jgi:SAM-dependent methyltransferase
MPEAVPFKPHRFRSAVAYYERGRPAYAPALIGRVVALCGVTPADSVLDLGCGPGLLALALAPHAGAVTAVDPEPEMLRAAAARAAEAGASIRFVEGSSYDIGPQLGRFRLVAIGRAFHWMDRAATLARLDTMVQPGGAVVLFDDKHPAVPDNDWQADYTALIERYAAGDGDRVIRKAPDWIPHEAVLLDSAFGALERISIIERRRTPVERFVDRALSLSSTTRERLGDQADELAQALRTAMARHAAADGAVAEVVESTALIARRPSEGA